MLLAGLRPPRTHWPLAIRKWYETMRHEAPLRLLGGTSPKFWEVDVKRGDGIAAFWKWWPTAEKRIAKAFATGGVSNALARIISKRVEAIDKRLDWEFGPGKKSAHHLCLSAVGDPEVRSVAERWLRRAPPAGKVWEFYAARQASESDGLLLTIDGHEVSFDELSIAATEDESRERIDLVVHHPVFAKVKRKDERRRIAFLALNTAFGEDDYERFVGALETPTKKADGMSLQAFKQTFGAFVAKATGEKWAVLEGKTARGARIVATMNRALKRIDHPLLDMHVTITIELQSPNDEGLTTREEGAALNALESKLLDALGENAANLGHETLEGQRIVHLHVMEGGPAAQIIARWVQRASRSIVLNVSIERDPHWTALERFD